MIKKQLKEISKDIKKNYLNNLIENNKQIKNEYKKYDTKMIMFKTFGLSNDIYKIFYDYSLLIQDFKNELSKIFFKNIEDIILDNYLNIDEEYNNLKKLDKYKIIYSKNFQDCYRDVRVKYENMIKSNLVWSKKVNILSYLTKFYYNGLKDYLLELKNNKKIKEYQEKALKLLEFDEDRVKKIIYNRRNRQLKNCKQIVYKKLTFINSNKISSYDNFITKYPDQILFSNKYKRQMNKLTKQLHGKNLKVLKTNAFIKVGLGFNKYDLPIRLSKEYHKDELIKTITKSFGGGSNSSLQMTNIIEIDEFKKEVIIKFAIKVKNKEIADKSINILGVDINTKNNLFYCSNGKNFKINKKLINKILKTEKRLKEKRNNKFKNLELTIKNDNSLTKEQKQQKIDEIKKLRIYNKNERRQALKNERRKKYLNDYMVYKLCKYAINKNYDSLVIEDLTFELNKNYIKNLEFNVNYNDLFCILHLRELKEIIQRIGNKYGLTVNITPASYTSQMCSICGYISQENRKCQEIFYCKNCGHIENADFNASKNIKNRIVDKNLLNLLHKKVENKNNTFEPKKIKYKQIKKILINYYKEKILIYKYFSENR